MSAPALTQAHRGRTLWLCGILHAFTHVYQVALLPLYLRIETDFRLPSVGKATFLVTSMMIAYFLPSYLIGYLADHVSRKKLLGCGLFLNALGFVGLALAPSYPMAVLGAVVAGFGGSFFHPAATAMVARLYPLNTGKALGLLGVGASIGFFVGPIYAGWRAATSGWRAPILELGLAGAAMSLLFWWLADPDARVQPAAQRPPDKMFPNAGLWFVFLIACVVFSLRDFAGSSMGTLGSLFLQQAYGYDIGHTGLTLSAIFIPSIISNPLFGRLSDRGRKRWTAFVLGIAAVIVAIFPHLPRTWLFPALLVYGFFFMSSYPIVEAALMESVPDSVRGRVFGCFITVGGLLGNLSHWLVGRWVENLGAAGSKVPSYYGMYRLLAVMIVVCLLGLPCLHFVRRREGLENSGPVPLPVT